MKVKIFKVYWCGNAEHPHKVPTKYSKCKQDIKVDKSKHGKGSFKAYVWEIDSVLGLDRSGGEIPNYCCEKMMEALDEDFITFGHPSIEWIRKPLLLVHQSKKVGGTETMGIEFCPFCGEPIEYEECGDYEGEK